MKKPQVLAFYLPQFHTIPENDEWWGEGFTEWTNVKKAKPLYRNHYQPRVPLNNNYYDLSNPHVMVKQMRLAKRAGVDGFCFYHYWFGGKKLLEKPLEQLLDNQKATLPFCLCWANEPWTRTWDGKEGAKEILMPQNYGDENEWREHFAYLLQFFKDERYIKLNNKPVFVIYSIPHIKKMAQRLKVWNKLAVDAGFDGIYTIGVNRGKIYDQAVDAVVDFEPFATLGTSLFTQRMRTVRNNFWKKIPIIRKYFLPIVKYSDLAKIMCEKEVRVRKKYYLGMFVGWDNTARRGCDALYIIGDSTPAKFKYFFEKQYIKSIKNECDFLFINAWNEWAEGTYLEPDQRFGYGYLDAIKQVVKKYADK